MNINKNFSMKGWFNDSWKHSLASKGIKTKYQSKKTDLIDIELRKKGFDPVKVRPDVKAYKEAEAKIKESGTLRILGYNIPEKDIDDKKIGVGGAKEFFKDYPLRRMTLDPNQVKEMKDFIKSENLKGAYEDDIHSDLVKKFGIDYNDAHNFMNETFSEMRRLPHDTSDVIKGLGGTTDSGINWMHASFDNKEAADKFMMHINTYALDHRGIKESDGKFSINYRCSKERPKAKKLQVIKEHPDKLIVKQVGNKFKLFDKNTGEFLIGYNFDKYEDARKFQARKETFVKHNNVIWKKGNIVAFTKDKKYNVGTIKNPKDNHWGYDVEYGGQK